jgi:hypothetical protein
VLPHVNAQDGAAAATLHSSSTRQAAHQGVVLVGSGRDDQGRRFVACALKEEEEENAGGLLRGIQPLATSVLRLSCFWHMAVMPPPCGVHKQQASQPTCDVSATAELLLAYGSAATACGMHKQQAPQPPCDVKTVQRSQGISCTASAADCLASFSSCLQRAVHTAALQPPAHPCSRARPSPSQTPCRLQRSAQQSCCQRCGMTA